MKPKGEKGINCNLVFSVCLPYFHNIKSDVYYHIDSLPGYYSSYGMVNNNHNFLYI